MRLRPGRDPAEAKDAQRTEQTVGVTLERFLTEHVDAKLKRLTSQEYRRIVKLHVAPSLKHRMLSEVKRADIAKLHHAMSEKPYQANRTLAFLSKFFNWCEKHGLRTDASNPCRHIEKYPEHKRERFLSSDELVRLGQALHDTKSEHTASEYVVAAVRLLALTGARLSEVLTLRWDYVDFDGACIRLPESKTGKKSVYLNAPALEVLSNLHRIAGNPYVICGERGR